MKVPTVVELAHLDLARRVTGETYRVSDEGHRLMGDAMRVNALAAVARGEGSWTRPPSNGLSMRHED